MSLAANAGLAGEVQAPRAGLAGFASIICHTDIRQIFVTRIFDEYLCHE